MFKEYFNIILLYYNIFNNNVKVQKMMISYKDKVMNK